jgi:hypothetical protein
MIVPPVPAPRMTSLFIGAALSKYGIRAQKY